MIPRDAPSLARSFYQRFLDASDRTAFLKGLVNSNPLTFETEWLEFKSCPHEGNDQSNDQKIKELWCINLSAFANTQGGVLIWGIGARPHNKVDAAHKLELVPSPDILRTRLFELHHMATDPPLSGVEMEAVTVPDEGGKGFVVCFIPQGHFVPYRAEFNINNYYVRIGDDSIVAPRVFLRRLFYPQSLARVETSVELSKTQKLIDNKSVDELKYAIFLENAGYATANDVYVIVKDNVIYSNPNGKGVIQSNSHWNMRYSTPNDSGFYALVPVHPGFVTDVAYSHRWTITSNVGADRVKSWSGPITINIDVFCRDTDRQAFEVEFVEQDVREVDQCKKKCKMVGGL